jgi:transcriptional regulator
MENELRHYGKPRRSGRYPWGSGEDPQRSLGIRSQVLELRKQGLSDVDIAKGLGMNSNDLRKRLSREKADEWLRSSARAVALHDHGYSNVKIGEIMGTNESNIRSFLNPTMQERYKRTNAITNMLKEAVAKKKYVDVGIGMERHMNISRTRLQTAISALEAEGYVTHEIKTRQLGTGKDTTILTLTAPGVPKSEVRKNKHLIRLVTDYSEDGGKTFKALEPIKNIDSKRILIRHGDEGGALKDGVIELRRGVEDLSLGDKRYAQVRIGVDGTHFMKGMAIYTDDIPKGVDVIYNTNKKKGTPPEKVFKPQKEIEIDSDNPFGSTIRQKHYIDKNGKEQLSALNVVGSKEGAGEEGAWESWSKTLSSQVLSKQDSNIARRQLGISYDIRKEEFDEIMSLNNPTVKKKRLDSFADECDSAAVQLKAAALPRQKTHVILPLDIKETEIHATNYDNGEKVILIRYPHGGLFEIPELTVNNKTKVGQKILGRTRDAVGINPKVAEHLSGADFDGDTVLVIPNPRGDIKTRPRLEALKDFDPKTEYAERPGMSIMTKRIKGIAMGDVTNLITDMTIQGAHPDKIAKAIKHSMVVIDAEKHRLDYKRSYEENGIAALKQEFQGSSRAGASTLISRASSDKRVGDRTIKRNKKKMTPEELAAYESGRKVYKYSGKTYNKYLERVEVDRGPGLKPKIKWVKVPYRPGIENEPNIKVEVVKSQIKSKKMAEEDNAFNLSSGTMIEAVYAGHANKLKELARQCRIESMKVEPLKQSSSAKKVYAEEVATLNARLNIALKNAPMERQAQLLADWNVKIKLAANPDLKGDEDELKKLRFREMTQARNRLGAGKQKIDISDRQWEAIQAGAVSNNTLMQILNNADEHRIKELSTPRTARTLTPAKIASAKQMLKNGYTQSEIAKQLGVSTTMINQLM